MRIVTAGNNADDGTLTEGPLLQIIQVHVAVSNTSISVQRTAIVTHRCWPEVM